MGGCSTCAIIQAPVAETPVESWCSLRCQSAKLDEHMLIVNRDHNNHNFTLSALSFLTNISIHRLRISDVTITVRSPTCLAYTVAIYPTGNKLIPTDAPVAFEYTGNIHTGWAPYMGSNSSLQHSDFECRPATAS